MEDTEAKPVTEDEAEAALGALGAWLEWSPKSIVSYIGTPNGTLYLYRSAAHTPEYWYSVYDQQKPGWKATCSPNPARGQEGLSVCPSFLPNEAAAKAACERHYVTGKWE